MQQQLIRELIGDTAALLRDAISSRVFRIFLAVDAFFILLHLYVATRPWETPTSLISYLRIDKDGGLSEMFEAGLLATALVGAVMLTRRASPLAFGLIAVIVGYLFVDNAFGFHEALGASLDPDQAALAESLPSLLAATVFAVWWLVAFWRVDTGTRTVMAAIAVVVGYIGFFGIVVDGLHGLLIAPHTPLDGPVTMIEDGNELIGMSLLCALMLLLRSRMARHEQAAAFPSTTVAAAGPLATR